MISSKLPLRIIGLPLVFGLATTPVFATTPDASGRIDLAPMAPITTSPDYPRLAQVGGDEIGGGGGGSTDGDERNRRTANTPPVEVTETQTSLIVQLLDQNERICEFMGDEYRIACFARTYRQVAEEIPSNGDYADARETLLDTARKLDALVRQNIDRQKPSLRATLTTSRNQQVRTPPIAAVRADRAPQLNQQAGAIVAEAETRLLRSASSDAKRAIHYQRIAAAVGSNKVLLRSG